MAVARQQLAEVKHEPEDSEDRMHAELESASALLAVGDLSSRLVPLFLWLRKDKHAAVHFSRCSNGSAFLICQ